MCERIRRGRPRDRRRARERRSRKIASRFLCIERECDDERQRKIEWSTVKYSQRIMTT